MGISAVTRAAIARIWEQNSATALFAPTGSWSGDLDEVCFLERLYPLNALPSSSPRHSDARAEVVQHCINNHDWDGFWVLSDDRFGLNDDAKLLRFLVETVHPAVRSDADACRTLANEYNKLLRRDGVELHIESHESGRPVYGWRIYTPSASEIRDVLARAIAAGVKADKVADFCTRIGLGPTSKDYGDPWASKAAYVRRHSLHAEAPQLLNAARAALVEIDDVDLRSIADAAAGGEGTGVKSAPKNLIFAAIGPKPELVLRDAISNDIEITKNAEFCLVYLRPLTDEGLSWQTLIDWWDATRADRTDPDVAGDLYRRLKASLSERSPGELLVLRTYGHLLKELGSELPALIPQVYLHLDPRTRISADDVLARQRMDFLMLFAGHRRVVIEVDGQQHYSTADGRASAARYGEMMAEDRRVRLAGYEVYRFGGAELKDPNLAGPMLRRFFVDLLVKHGVSTSAPGAHENS